MIARRLALALVHHPVVDAEGAIVTTAVTNLDVHDLARSARTFGASDLFIVHPIAAQRALVEKIREHWTHGSSSRRIPARKEAMTRVRVVERLEDAARELGEPELWITAARDVAPPLSYADARQRLASDGPPVLLVFGTGWGLAPSVVQAATAVLPPIRAGFDTGYNHLSVRAACAIILDRLCGPGA